VSDERADLILDMLRAIRADQAAQLEKLDEIITRIGALEREVAALSLRIAEIRVDFAACRYGSTISTVASDGSSIGWSWPTPPPS
jgi:hypothetical protein